MKHQPQHQFTTVIITLHGSDTARFEPLGLKVTKARGSVIAALCRKMITAGLAPEVEAMVMRGDTLCFVPMAIGYWAGLRVEEGAYTTARFRACTSTPESAVTTS